MRGKVVFMLVLFLLPFITGACNENKKQTTVEKKQVTVNNSTDNNIKLFYFTL